MLEGNNIILRPLKDSDFHLLEKIENNINNWQFGSENKIYSKDELLEYISNSKIDIRLAKQFRFVIDFNRAPIGFIDLFNYAIDSADVGIIILNNYRRRGFAKEALSLLLIYANKTLNIETLYCRIKKNNISSMKLFTSCGFHAISNQEEVGYFIKLAKNLK
tara:strand:+ start:31701 stop:32186 length:486 start_codon:yes stop_codon:yes gene_type:complete